MDYCVNCIACPFWIKLVYGLVGLAVGYIHGRAKREGEKIDKAEKTFAEEEKIGSGESKS